YTAPRLSPPPFRFGVADIEAIGAGILRDDEKLLHARRDEALGFAHDIVELTALQSPAKRRNDAEAAAIVAALGDLQIGVVPRRQPEALRRDQIEIGIVRSRHRLFERSEEHT